ncbi:MAG: hypothetical protein JSU90_08300 [Nitrospiraceae bacterium]|nr:MAG: hypothetical protein JSU90_08300 [Nitrospiraceae bacterium]
MSDTKTVENSHDTNRQMAVVMNRREDRIRKNFAVGFFRREALRSPGRERSAKQRSKN